MPRTSPDESGARLTLICADVGINMPFEFLKPIPNADVSPRAEADALDFPLPRLVVQMAEAYCYAIHVLTPGAAQFILQTRRPFLVCLVRVVRRLCWPAAPDCLHATLALAP